MSKPVTDAGRDLKLLAKQLREDAEKRNKPAGLRRSYGTYSILGLTLAAGAILAHDKLQPLKEVSRTAGVHINLVRGNAAEVAVETDVVGHNDYVLTKPGANLVKELKAASNNQDTFTIVTRARRAWLLSSQQSTEFKKEPSAETAKSIAFDQVRP